MPLTESQKKAQAKWRANNKDKVNANIRRYRENNPEINAESNRKSSMLYVAKKKGFNSIDEYKEHQERMKIQNAED